MHTVTWEIFCNKIFVLKDAPLSLASYLQGPFVVAYLRWQTGASPLHETRVPETSHVLWEPPINLYLESQHIY